MMNNFTTEDLLRYSYNETSAAQTAEIKAALQIDFELQEKLQVITSAQNRLEKLQLSPSQRSIDAILQYAEKNVAILST
jgi:hypothetical protein